MKDWSGALAKALLREALEQRVWSVMTRGLRDYLIRVAEDDGALIRDAADPVAALVAALGAHAEEAGPVWAAIELLSLTVSWPAARDRSFVERLPEAHSRPCRPRSAPLCQRFAMRKRREPGDAHIALITIDYPNRARLKKLGRAEMLEGEQAQSWLERVRAAEYKAVVERVFVIRLAALDWNCSQHITPRYTAEEVEQALEQTVARIRELEQENDNLRELADRKSRA